MDSSDESVDGWTVIKDASTEIIKLDQNTNLHCHEKDNIQKEIILNKDSKFVGNFCLDKCKLEMDSQSSSSEFDILEAPLEMQLEFFETSLKDISLPTNPDIQQAIFTSSQQHSMLLNETTNEMTLCQPQSQSKQCILDGLSFNNDINRTLELNNTEIDNANENKDRSGGSSQSDFEVLSPKSNELLNICEMWDNYDSSTSLGISHSQMNENEFNLFPDVDFNVSRIEDATVLIDKINGIDNGSTLSCYSIICKTLPEVDEVGGPEKQVYITNNDDEYEHLMLTDNADVNFRSRNQLDRADVNLEQLFDSYYDASDPEQIVQMFHEIVRLRKMSDRTNQRQEPDDSLLIEDGDDRCESEMSFSDSWDLSTWSGSIEMGDDGLIGDVRGRRLRAYHHQPNPVLDHRLNILAITALIFTAGIAIGHYCGSNFNFRIKSVEHVKDTQNQENPTSMVSLSHQVKSTTNQEKTISLATTTDHVIDNNLNLLMPLKNPDALIYNESFESESNIAMLMDLHNYSQNIKYFLLQDGLSLKFKPVEPINWYLNQGEIKVDESKEKFNEKINDNNYFELMHNEQNEKKNEHIKINNWYIEHIENEKKERQEAHNIEKNKWYLKHSENEKILKKDLKEKNWYLEHMENKDMEMTTDFEIKINNLNVEFIENEKNEKKNDHKEMRNNWYIERMENEIKERKKMIYLKMNNLDLEHIKKKKVPTATLR